MTHIKKLTEANYADVSKLAQYAFQYKLSEAEFEKKKKQMASHDIWGWMVNGNIGAKVHIIPLSCYIAGHEFTMGGISSVATWPEFRRQGMIKKLLHHALTEMKAAGQTISFLHPFSIPFYRKYGWELVFNQMHNTIPIEKLKHDFKGDGYIRRANGNLAQLQSLYTTYAKTKSGMLNRDESWWDLRVLKEDQEIVIAYNAADEAEGYLIYHVKANVFHVHEMIDCTLNAKKVLLEFIANHDSMAKEVNMIVPDNDNLPLIIDDPTFEQRIKPYFMARIVDAYAFLCQYPFLEKGLSGSILLHLTDEFFPENNGAYEIDAMNQNKKVSFRSKAINKIAIQCSIQQLTVMLMGYKRPMELFQAGLINGEEKAIRQLDELIPVQQTFFPDFY